MRTILSILVILFVSITSRAAQKPGEDLYKQLETFAGVIAEVDENYVDTVKPPKLIEGALQGMLRSLDEYSQFLDADAYKEMQIETQGRFGGLGIVIAIKDGVLIVISPIEDTPAYKAGIKANDKIVKIENESTKNMSLFDAVKKLRGPGGTTVNITIMREGEKELMEFKLTRAIIKIVSVKNVTLTQEDKIGYIRVTEFQEKTADILRDEVVKLKNQGMRALVVDLRNNPGGLLASAISVSEIFVPEKKIIVSTQGRRKDQNVQYPSHGGPGNGLPLAILINSGSASASEIVAGAIQDLKLGVVVGTKSFGKGSVQTVIPLEDGTALRLTTARYYTPSGKCINGDGIHPDVVLELSKEAEDRLMELRMKDQGIEDKGKEPVWWKEDQQLNQAINILKANLILSTAPKGNPQ
jgi:carboxyl-terminal processing protease